jgi:hypothetical protein
MVESGENPICRLSYIEIEVNRENPREAKIDYKLKSVEKGLKQC